MESKANTVADQGNYSPLADAIRGLCALAVILGHTCYVVTTPFHFASFSKFVTDYNFAVQFFFGMSGYLLFGSMTYRERTETELVRNFYVRRVFRILPMWWVTVVLYRIAQSFPLKILVANLFMYFGFFSYIPEYSPVPQSWSLFVEETFYLLFPLAFTRLKRPFTVVLFALAAYLASDLMWSRGEMIGMPKNEFHLLRVAVSNYIFFFLGILTFQFHRQPRLRKLVDGAARGGLVTALDLAAAVFFALAFYIRLPLLPHAAFFAVLLALTDERSRAAKIVNNRVFRAFGIRCYSIYLLHLLVSGALNPLKDLFFRMSGLGSVAAEFQVAAWFPVLCAACLAAGMIGFRLVEMPSVDAGRRMILKLKSKEKSGAEFRKAI